MGDPVKCSGLSKAETNGTFNFRVRLLHESVMQEKPSLLKWLFVRSEHHYILFSVIIMIRTHVYT